MATLPHRLTRDTAGPCALALQRLLNLPEGQPRVLDLAGVEAIDSVGAALLAQFCRQATAAEKTFTLRGLRPNVERALKLFRFVDTPPPVKNRQLPLFERLGGSAAYAAELCMAYTLLCADVAYFTVAGLWQRRGIRLGTVLSEMSNMGSQAFFVVGLIAFLVGGTVALQSAAQLRQFGASLFVADLIGVSITRELGPLITAIVVAGRSGSAVAAEIGTMVITEEVDALRTMGLNPVRFLVVPKVLAISLTQPLLTVLANTLAIFGGFLVAVLYLDVSASAFLGRLQTALFVKDVLTGLFKSLLFANLIVTLGALCGLRTAGGADAVGRSTTTSVVAAIFAIIVADAGCSLVFYFGA
jgi:phospholipid/cholesterol/gamma-HCH transport system permease protein